MIDPNPPSASYDTLLVEVMVGKTPNYLICARLDGPAPIEGMGGVTREQIEELFRGGTMRCAPLPKPKQPVLRTATVAQSMNGIDLGGGG